MINKVYLKHTARIVFAILLLVACLYYLEVDIVLKLLQEIKIEFYILALVCTFLGTIYLPAVVTWKSLAVSDIEIPLNKLVQINLVIRFYILIVPRAVAMGIRWYRYQKDASGYEAAALIMFERVVQMLVVSVMGAIFIFFDLGAMNGQGYLLLLFLLGLSVVLVLVFLLFLIPRFSCWAEAVFQKLNRYAPKIINARLQKLWSAISAFREIGFGDAIAILNLSIIAYILFILSAWILLQGIQLDVNLQTLIWIRSVVFLLALIPISIGGIGVRDVTIIYYLSFFGISQEHAFAFSLAILAVQLSLGLVGALIEFTQLLRKYFTVNR